MPVQLNELEQNLRQHAGEFLCERIHDKKSTKVVRFVHVLTSPDASMDLPKIGRLDEFYAHFGSILFYYDEKSGDAAKHIAPSSQWAELHSDFSDWIDALDEDERDEILPDWVESCLVIGKTPHSGNYILVATEGSGAGRIFEFDHDGFEFRDEADDVIDYVHKLLKPDGARLTGIASHMRFVEDDPMTQWWIREFKDNQGHIVRTDV